MTRRVHGPSARSECEWKGPRVTSALEGWWLKELTQELTGRVIAREALGFPVPDTCTVARSALHSTSHEHADGCMTLCSPAPGQAVGRNDVGEP